MAKPSYSVQWCSIDGAGHYPTLFRTRGAAVALADALAHRSNTAVVSGRYVNPWEYTYIVRDGRGHVVYRAPMVKGHEVDNA